MSVLKGLLTTRAAASLPRWEPPPDIRDSTARVETLAVPLERKAVFTFLICVNAALVGLSLIPVPSYTFRSWFDLDQEANVPTWFSSVQLLMIGLVSAGLWRRFAAAGMRSLSRCYLMMAAGFLFLSADETATIHEGLTTIARKTQFRSPLPDGHAFWIFLYPLLVAIAALLVRRGLKEFFQEKEGRAWIVAGAFLLFLGAVSFETLGFYLHHAATDHSTAAAIEVTIEEALELVGQSMILFGFLVRARTLRLEF
jgi:hypothetical protein